MLDLFLFDLYQRGFKYKYFVSLNINSYKSRVLGEFCNLPELIGQHAESGPLPVLPLVVLLGPAAHF